MDHNPSATISWSQLTHEDWSLHLAASEQGLCFIGSQGQALDELAQWADAHRLPGSVLIRDDEALQPYAEPLIAYLQGTRTELDLPLDYRGTPFQTAVWQALLTIPYGQTASYSDIAQAIQRPAAVRAVGAAIGANPILIAVPCHRVIGKSGALTGYRGGMAMKTGLLELERRAESDAGRMQSG
jgi:methylated-DNA-[protein]-cysteine S-methyltransferase